MTALEKLRDDGVLAPLDVRFAQALARLAAERFDAATPPEVLLAAALVSRQVTEGHVCVDLAAPPIVTDGNGARVDVVWPDPQAWSEALAQSPLVAAAVTSGDVPEAPFVLDPAGRLYLQRFWCHQRELAAALRERALCRFAVRDPGRLRSELVSLFPKTDASFPWQRAAALTAILRGLTVVTGGPGTGKTATVVRLLTLLLGEAHRAGEEPPRILLLAPTGKAAARLTESIEAAIPALDSPAEIIAALPRSASTIHRALGSIGSTASRFRHDADHPLIADAVVVDEASMVDLALMNRLISAVPRRARLVLLGDRDQLASVEAGAVLGDLCDARVERRSYSAAHLDDLSKLGAIELPGLPLFAPKPGLRDSIVRLAHSYRYDAESGIGRLAKAIRDGRAADALDILESGESAGVRRLEPPAEGLHADAEAEIAESFRPALESESPADALAALNRFRVLCAHRSGPSGVTRVNARIVELLRERDLLGARGGHYPGRAILVTRNDYTLGLFNGDVGLVLRSAAHPDSVLAMFPAPGGALRGFSTARLPAHETAFAMTVHKTQGSEVERLVLVLPESSPLVTRELLYTAVTRARRGMTVQASRRTIEEGIATETRRASGLADLLWASPLESDA